MRIWLPIMAAATLVAATGMVMSATKAKALQSAPVPAADNIYAFNLTRIDGKPMPLSAYQGKVVLLVNTASMCGFTPQYEGLQKLQQNLGPRGFTIVGVPSGDFRSQEYDDNAKIKEFCESKFGITFPMAEKSHVTGAQAIPLYRWVKAHLKAENEPKWNFHKFLIGRDGKPVAGFGSKVSPDSTELQAAIEKALKA